MQQVNDLLDHICGFGIGFSVLVLFWPWGLRIVNVLPLLRRFTVCDLDCSHAS